MKLLMFLILPYHLLTWSDFKGKPDTYDNVANTACGSELHSEIINGLIYYRVSTVFDSDKSWTITSDENVLVHERGHLDICEIFVRRELKAIYKFQGGKDDFWNEVSEIDDKYIKERQNVQALYDKETNHSLNHESQLRWNVWIAQQLKK